MAERRLEPVDFVEIFFGVAAVIGNHGVDVGANRCQEAHQRAHAITKDGNLALAVGCPSSSKGRVHGLAPDEVGDWLWPQFVSPD